MSAVPTVYRRVPLTPPAGVTIYTIADYTVSGATMDSLEDYTVEIENPTYVKLIGKTLTTFTINATFSSPAFVNQIWLCFRKTGI